VGRDQAERFFVIGQRQEIVEILVVVRGPREMTRDENRVDYVDERAHPPQVDMIDPSNAAHRDSDGVHRDRVIAAHFEQKLGCVRIGEKVFRVNFEPRH